MFGFLNINKPQLWTSRKAVSAVHRLVKPWRAGHAGTLDPLATGVLVVCVGPATRLAKFVQAMPKSYLANFRLGLESDTEDLFGNTVEIAGASPVTAGQLESVIPEFIGQIMQTPPKFSALKINGKRAYQLARKGKEVQLAARPVQIQTIKLTRFDYPDFQLSIRCGSGTYIRSLGRDIGKRLGSGAIMTNLERTAIGNFAVESGISPEDLTHQCIVDNLILPQIGLPQMPQVIVPDEQVQRFVNGHALMPEPSIAAEEALAIDQSGRLLTVLKKRSPGVFTPAVNFSHYWLDQPS